MPHDCNHCDHEAALRRGKYRRLLWVALALNVAMFAIEVAASLKSNSVSLLADSIDFLGDSANYGLSLFVLGMSVTVRAKASLAKALSMLVFGFGVLSAAAWHAATDAHPEASTMGVVGALALVVNCAVALMLFAHREGDSNMRSVWLCTRNDALGNIAVLLAALGVFGTGAAWPDLAVAGIMATLAVTSAFHVLRQARGEIRASHDACGSAPSE
jgi:Co/Zn/Cd efflux system component